MTKKTNNTMAKGLATARQITVNSNRMPVMQSVPELDPYFAQGNMSVPDLVNQDDDTFVRRQKNEAKRIAVIRKLIPSLRNRA